MLWEGWLGRIQNLALGPYVLSVRVSCPTIWVTVILLFSVTDHHRPCNTRPKFENRLLLILKWQFRTKSSTLTCSKRLLVASCCLLPRPGVTRYFAPQEIWHPHSIGKIGTHSGNLPHPHRGSIFGIPAYARYPRISCTPPPIILGYHAPTAQNIMHSPAIIIILEHHAPQSRR